MSTKGGRSVSQARPCSEDVLTWAMFKARHNLEGTNEHIILATLIRGAYVAASVPTQT